MELKKNKKKEEELAFRVDTFVRNNSIVLTLGIAFTFLVLNYRISSLVDTVEDTLVKNTRYIKKNIGHPIFLSATGQVVSSSKSPMSYNSSMFIQYIENILSDTFFGGVIKYSQNYKKTYGNAERIIASEERVGKFTKVFAARKEVVLPFARDLHWALTENTLPEYVDIYHTDTSGYRVSEDVDGDEKTYQISGRIAAVGIVKSWIVDLNAWDTRETSLSIEYTATIDLMGRGSIANPFGLRFDSLTVSVPAKPTARFIKNEKK